LNRPRPAKMSRPATIEEQNARKISRIEMSVFPHPDDEMEREQEAKCKICGLDDGDGLCEDETEWTTIIGWFVCKNCCRDCIPRFARMMALGSYCGPNDFNYEDLTSDEDEEDANNKNAEALRGYRPSRVEGFSQPDDWNSPLTEEWITGYKSHLLSIRRVLNIVLERRRRLENREKMILTGLCPLDDEWVEDEDEGVPAPPGGLSVMPAQKTNDDLVFEMMEIIDKLKETEKMNDNDYLILCNNLKKIREQLMLIRR
jgi:hypothetical protein